MTSLKGMEGSFCFNCVGNVDETKLSRCSRCKTVMYCSPVCHKEHWLTVHKKHCKYLAGEAKFPGWEKHDENNCFVCIESRMLDDKYFQEQSEHLICTKRKSSKVKELFTDIFGGGTRLIEMPFSNGEVSGEYLNAVDQTFATLYILMDNFYERDNEDREVVLDLINNVADLRRCYWVYFLKYGLSDWKRYRPNGQMNVKVLNLIKQVDDQIGFNKRSTDANQVDIWQTFLLVWTIFMNTDYNPRKPKDIRRDKFDVLNRSEDGVVLIKTLRKIKEELVLLFATESERASECFSCARKLSLENTYLICDSMKWLSYKKLEAAGTGHSAGQELFNSRAMFQDERMDKPFILLHCLIAKLYLCCGAVDCKKAIGIDYDAMQEAKAKKEINDLFGALCSNCSEFSQETHRCSGCKSKQYCSIECRNEDWEKVHSKMCKDYKESCSHLAPGSAARREMEETRLNVFQITKD